MVSLGKRGLDKGIKCIRFYVLLKGRALIVLLLLIKATKYS